jgi:hypothetical protein
MVGHPASLQLTIEVDASLECPPSPTIPWGPGYTPEKNLGIADARRWVLAQVGNKEQQFNTPGFMPV